MPSISSGKPGYELVDFAEIEAVPCPCGMARRAFAEVADFPGTVHVTEIIAGRATALSQAADGDLFHIGV